MPRPSQQSYAQFGEDRLLHRLIGESDGVYVEVGGNNGIEASNSYYFEKLGRRCILVEPIPYMVEQIRGNRACVVVEAAADEQSGTAEFVIARGGETLSTLDNENRFRSRVDEHPDQERITVRTARLDQILEETGLVAGRDHIDLLSIDVEGNELRALRGLSVAIWRPRVIILEDNSFGRDHSVRDHLAQAGYTRFKVTGVNHWYCDATDARLNTWLRRRVAGVKSAIVRIYGAVSGRGRHAVSRNSHN
ncbi:MAG: FkbM family methyltransferase [Spirochaetaceae bacterium]|nr:MAG: FkbM family methyltransferase [Spirochaetaceae bacterium]